MTLKEAFEYKGMYEWKERNKMSKSTEKLFALRDVIRSMKLSSAKVNLEAAFADYITALVEEQNDPEVDDRK